MNDFFFVVVFFAFLRVRFTTGLLNVLGWKVNSTGSAAFATAGDKPTATARAARSSITSVDFRRGDGGEGRVIVTLSDPSTVVDTFEEGGRIIVEFVNTALPQDLSRRLDVIDFATPVKILVNGKTAFEKKVVPDMATMLDLAREFDDRGRIFHARVKLAISNRGCAAKPSSIPQ